MPTVAAIAEFLEEFAPVRLAEEWDNVGLLVGDPERNVEKVMTCLSVTPQSAAEAIEAGADLIVTHHPLPFVPTKQFTTKTTGGRLLLDLIGAKVAIYSPHTAFDSAARGINARLAEGLGLRDVAPLIPHLEAPKGDSPIFADHSCAARLEKIETVPEGTGRWGSLAEPMTLTELAQRLKNFLSIEHMHVVGAKEKPIRTVAVACGAADELLDAARANHCDAMVIGEARFHTCLAAEAADIALLLPGHFASERFAVEGLAEVLAKQFPTLSVWASRSEEDPVRTIE